MNTVLEQTAEPRTAAHVMPEPNPSSEHPFTNSSGYLTGEEFMRSIENHFASSSIHTPPPGYMTGDEFSRSIIENLRVFYKEHGLL